MRRSTQRIQASSRQRRLKLAAAATLGLAILAGSALYLLHRTMPVPMQAGAGSGPSGKAALPASAAPTATAGSAATGAGGTDLRGLPADSAVGPLPRPESAPVSLRVPVPSEPARHPDKADGERRADDPRARRAAGRESARNGGSEAGGSLDGRAPRSGWGGELEAGSSAAVGPYEAPAATRSAKTTSPTAAAATASARSASQRLEPLQQTQCGDSEFLMRLICDERVRLRFCQSRWNAHPDCMVEARTLTY